MHFLAIHIKNRAWSPPSLLPSPSLCHVFYINFKQFYIDFKIQDGRKKKKKEKKKKKILCARGRRGGGIGGAPL